MNFDTDIEVYQASDIQIDATVIDVSEVDEETDKAFLREKGANILMIEAKADFAIKKIITTIQGRAGLEKGKHIVEVQERFKASGERGLTKWYKSIGLNLQKANRLANAYRAVDGFRDLFDGMVEPEKILECTDTALAKIQQLPQDFREEMMAEVAVGNIPTSNEVDKVIAKPEVKLSKAQELLTAAKARKEKAEERWEEVKADPEISSSDMEYKTARYANVGAIESVKNYEQQVAELQEQIEEEKLKTAEAAEREAKAAAELQKLKFDDAKARAERIKRLTTSLTVGVPQALADLQKFFAEKEHYPDDVRKHVLEQATYLANYIGDNL